MIIEIPDELDDYEEMTPAIALKAVEYERKLNDYSDFPDGTLSDLLYYMEKIIRRMDYMKSGNKPTKTERLTVRKGNLNLATPKSAYDVYTEMDILSCASFCKTQDDCTVCPIGECFDKLADYEDAEEEGRLHIFT